MATGAKEGKVQHSTGTQGGGWVIIALHGRLLVSRSQPSPCQRTPAWNPETLNKLVAPRVYVSIYGRLTIATTVALELRGGGRLCVFHPVCPRRSPVTREISQSSRAERSDGLNTPLAAIVVPSLF